MIEFRPIVYFLGVLLVRLGNGHVGTGRGRRSEWQP